MSRHFWWAIGWSLIGFMGICLWQQSEAAYPTKRENLATPKRLAIPANAQKATFAGGCFWGVEETFRKVPGVVDTRAGYTGGTQANPTYESMHRDKTGHVEAVEVTFDPSKVRYEQLLTIYFQNYDGTRPGKEDVAMGRQYRSFIFCHDDSQEKAAHRMLQELSVSRAYKGAPRPLVTQIRPAPAFWLAEERHQRYYEKRGMRGACSL